MKRRGIHLAAYAALALAVTCLALIAAGAIGHRLGWLHFRPALSLLRWSALLALPTTALALLTLLTAALRRAPAAAVAAGLALAAALAVFVPAYAFKSRAESVPPIHDISTDTLDPPAFLTLRPAREAAPNSAEYPGEPVARQQHAAYPDIQPLTLPFSGAEAFRRALAAAEAMDWQIAAADPARGRIEAVATTLVFGFKDDVVIRVRELGPDASQVDVRSASRVGRSDVGANAARIRGFRGRLLGE